MHSVREKNNLFNNQSDISYLYSQAVVQRCSYGKVFWKYAANLEENILVKGQFQWSCKATLLKPHFDMDVLLQICCIYSEHLFLRTPLEGCSVYYISLYISNIKAVIKMILFNWITLELSQPSLLFKIENWSKKVNKVISPLFW